MYRYSYTFTVNYTVRIKEKHNENSKGGVNNMFHCPHCGSSIHEEEQFCVVCGKKLPKDIDLRLKETKQFNRWWFMPFGLIASIIFAMTLYFLILQAKHEQANHHYLLGSEHIEEMQYTDALAQFELAISYKPSFSQAKIAMSFLNIAKEVDEALLDLPQLIEDKQYNDAIEQIDTLEDELNDLQGQAVNEYLNILTNQRDNIDLAKIKDELENDPSINKLKILLWDAESIKNEDGIKVTEEIRTEIIDFTFSKASEQLNNNQFNDALLIVKDGLKYAEESTKLQSLKTTIDKEKSAFETAQQERIEQAVTIAEAEEQHNRNDAIQLDNVDIEYNDKGNVIVKGKVKSGATVPITSVFVEYELYIEGNDPFVTNRVFVFPDVLYPDEYGNFEFTHYDIDAKQENFLVNVNKITWYVD